MVADALADQVRCLLQPGKGEFLAGTGSFRGRDILIAKPVTSMNESGIAVSGIVEQYGVPLEQVLVIVDDFQIPLGSLRMRPMGSDGGHNGLYSIIYQLQSESFPRLRCGIGSGEMPVDKSLMAEFVLSEFTANERPTVEEMVNRAVDACLSFAVDGIDKTMSLFNRVGEEKQD